jgi:hypothetical protein
MALNQLVDRIDTTVFQDLPAVNSPEKTAFSTSGVVVRSPLLDELANGVSKTAELPFWNDIDSATETNYSDDTENSATPAKIVQGEQIARKAFVNRGWKEADLAAELSMGGDALTHVRNRTDTYFQRQWQKRIIAQSNGILADNVANYSSDMVNDVASESIAGQTSATRWSRGAFTAAIFTLGDSFGEISAVGVHSAVYKQMVDADDIDFIPDSNGSLIIPTFMGKTVIVDDGMTVTAGTTDGLKYTTVLYGAGAFGYGEGMAQVPVEVDREASQGNGGGTEALWVRKTWIIHPFGFKSQTTPANGNTFTLAELATAAVWDRVIPRKSVPLAYLVTN